MTRTLGRYELIANIGTGGMAEVHLARQRGPMGFEKLVVVKTVHGHLAAQRDFIDMLLEEARIAALVKHANVVDIYDLGVADGSYFIAMEYLEGEPLLALLRAGKQGTRLDPLSMARLISDCAEGLHAAHELHAMSGQPLSVVHHDVSPGNVMVLFSGEVKLVDFGVAKAENQIEQQGERVLMKGKMSYMAPEKLRGAPGDRRSDVFSLGVVLWEAMTLRRLFRADSDKEVARMIVAADVPPPSTLDPTAPAELDPIVARALAKDPAKRYPTAKAMAAALEELLRKAGYSGKNDKIREYMHATFGDRLATRRELIRSMSGTGAAPTAQAIAHAFRTDPTFSVTVPPPPRAIGTPPGGASSESSRAHTEELSTFTEVEAYRAPSGVLDQAWRDGETVEDGVSIQQVPPPARRDAVVIAAVIAVGLVVATVGFVLTRGGSTDATPAGVAAAEDRPPPIAPAPTPPEVAPEEAVVVPPAAAPSPIVVYPREDKVERERSDDKDRDRVRDRRERDRDRDDKARDRPRDRDAALEPRPVPSANADSMTKDGMKLFVAGKLSEAVASFEHARQRAPGYAPAYRGLGMVKQRMGDKAGAAAAFKKYLELAPKAGDAAAIRTRLEQL